MTDYKIGGRLLEILSELEHEQWSEWAARLIAQEDGLSKERVERYDRLSRTPYAELSDELKEADRFWARKVLEALGIDQWENGFFIDGKEHLICASVPGECGQFERMMCSDLCGALLPSCQEQGWRLVCLRPKEPGEMENRREPGARYCPICRHTLKREVERASYLCPWCSTRWTADQIERPETQDKLTRAREESAKAPMREIPKPT